MTRHALILFVAALLLALAACAGNQRTASPNDVFYSYAGSLRWHGLERALDYVDPEVLAAQPPSELELERVRQVDVKGYQVTRTTAVDAETIQRDVEFSLVNRHTQRERVVRHRETWRYDAQAKRWWLASGLPDITAD